MLLKIKKERTSIIPNKVASKAATKLKLNSQYYENSVNKTIKYKVTNVVGGSSIMFGAGIMSGLLGIGSGMYKVIAMDNVMKMPFKPSSATSNLMMGVTAAASAIVYFIAGTILPEVAVPVCIGVLLGAVAGTRIMPKLHPVVLRVLFILVMIFFFIQMLTKAVMLF